MGFDLAKNKDGPTTTDGSPLVFKFDKSIFRLRSMGDSLLSNNARDYQPGYAKKGKAGKKDERKGKPADYATEFNNHADS
jgi:hypothetical protein